MGVEAFLLSRRRFFADVLAASSNLTLHIHVDPQNNAGLSSESNEDPSVAEGSKAIPMIGSCACFNCFGRVAGMCLDQAGN